MNNEKFVKYYVEILTSTMQDAVIRNVSLQTNAKITEEVIQEQAKVIEGLYANIDELIQQIEKNEIEYNSVVEQYEINKANLNNEIVQLKDWKNNFESTKHQIEHIDIFRDELIKCRKENEDIKNEYEKKIYQLTQKIEPTQLPITKKKKVEELKKEMVESPQEEEVVDKVINNTDPIKRDGGSF